jgi:predicted RecB family endonuclease
MEEIDGEFFLESDDIDNVSEEDMERLEELVEEYQFILQEHEDKLTHILGKINNTKVYKELGIEIGVSTEYLYSIEEREE